MNPAQIVEAVLFASDAPLNAEEIARADDGLDEDHVEEAIRSLQAEYADADRAFQIVELGEGYQILTRPDFAPYLERFDTVPRSSRLSGPALETLAIIAYRQPIGRVEVEYIRGVGSSGVIRTLQDRGMVEVVGRGEGLGRPLLYGTTEHFLGHFGFRSLEDLPRPEELPVVLRDRVPIEPYDDEDESDGAEGESDTAEDEPEKTADEPGADSEQSRAAERAPDGAATGEAAAEVEPTTETDAAGAADEGGAAAAEGYAAADEGDAAGAAEVIDAAGADDEIDDHGAADDADAAEEPRA